jgi:hypothetical protein
MQSQAQSARTLMPEKLAPISEDRPSSAQGNLQSHPCFQASLFNDNERAVGNFDEWHKRFHKARPNTQSTKIQKDYQLEQVIWSQTVKIDFFFSSTHSKSPQEFKS